MDAWQKQQETIHDPQNIEWISQDLQLNGLGECVLEYIFASPKMKHGFAKTLIIISFDGKNLKTHESYEVLNKQTISLTFLHNINKV